LLYLVWIEVISIVWFGSGKRKRPLGFPSGLSEDSRRWYVTYVSDSLSRWGERLVFTAAKPAAI
jgi:hypothetical protein